MIVGRATATLTAGASKVVRAALNATGRRLLKARHVLSATLTVSEGGLRLSNQIVRLKKSAKKAPRRH